MTRMEFYDLVRTHRRRATIPQWTTLVRLDQYRLPFRITAEHIAPGNRVLDWGCGNGHFAFYLATAFADREIRVETYSFESAPAILEALPAPIRHTRAAAGEPVRLPFPPETFDEVFSVGVLEHVHETGGDPAGSLREIHRILKPGGKFLCFHVPRTASWIEFATCRLYPALGIPRYTHTKKFSLREIRRLLASADLELLETRCYRVIPRNVLGRHHASVLDRRSTVALVNALDLAGGSLLPWIAQDRLFVARK